jgi:hypothetical protein
VKIESDARRRFLETWGRLGLHFDARFDSPEAIRRLDEALEAAREPDQDDQDLIEDQASEAEIEEEGEA